MTAAAQTEYTFDDLLAVSDADGKVYELVRGQLVEKDMSALAVWIAFRIAHLIENHVETTRRGWVYTELPINCFAWIRNHGRRPDVSYFHAERLPGEPTEDAVTIAPNLIVEVLSRHDNAVDLDMKLGEYFLAGVEIVWIVNPQTRTVRIHRKDRTVSMLHEDDVITGDFVLPQFQSPVREFFPQPAAAKPRS